MRYPGGKGKCYQRLINLMPSHRVYIESHLGGGSVFLRKRPANRTIGIDRDPKVIAMWQAKPRPSCELVCEDAAEFLSSYTFVGDELVYADPPYVHSTRRKTKLYRHEYSDADHERLLDVLRTLPCKVMLSGYPCELYENKLLGWERVSFSVNSQAGVREECVWMNFTPPDDLHDGRFLGDNFRERQAIKRRYARMEHKFSKLEPRERNELLKALNRRFGVRPGE